MSIKEQTVKDVDDDHIDQGIGRKHGFCHGDAKETGVGIHGHQVIKFSLIGFYVQKQRDNKSEGYKKSIKSGTKTGHDDKIFMCGSDVSGKN